MLAFGRLGNRGNGASDIDGALEMFRLLRRTRRTRLQLADLTEDQLRDIGLTREAAQQEVKRSMFLTWGGPVSLVSSRYRRGPNG